ncbi:MAG: C25 family cysteine peptidase [Anaerolineae bacterium]|nr:C25 family cysteine peptidase [Anaerolineae bacterium]
MAGISWALVLLGALALTLGACGRRQLTQELSPQEQIRITVRDGGLYRLSDDALRAAGVDLRRLGEDDLQLTNQGKAVPFALIGRGRERSLVFYARPSGSIYSPYNVYWLRRAPGQRLSSIQVAGAGEEAATIALVQSHLEEQRQYLSTLPAAEDHWLWQPIYGGRSVTVTFDLAAALASGEASLRVSLWSHSSALVNPDHHVIIRLNEMPVADVTWDGQGRQILRATLPAGVLQPGQNQLTITAPGDTNAPAELSYLDWVEVSYPRYLQADAGWLDFWAGEGAFQITELPDGEVALWDVTDPEQPVPLDGFQVSRAGDRQAVRFQRSDTKGARHYWIAAGKGFLEPEAVEVRPLPRSPRPEGGADYIAIVHPELAEAVQPLLNHRAGQGLRVFTITSAELYDAYTFGLPDPAAIRDFLAEALHTWPEPKPRFALLVGDASYDTYGYTGGPERNLIPTALVQTHFVGQTASDNWLADIDDDGRPDIALGRLPAQRPDQVRAMVDKALRWERESGSDWIRQALMAADDEEPYFVQMSEILSEKYLGPKFQARKVYLGQVEDPHAHILEAMNQGVGLVNYIGHGSVTLWAKEKVFSTEDVLALRNSDRPFLLINLTCLTGYFHHPQTVSLAEALLRAPSGGAVAALVPTSESLPADQMALAETLYSQITDPQIQTLGEAVLQAKRLTPLERDGQRDVVATFNLLGDPALPLPR